MKKVGRILKQALRARGFDLVRHRELPELLAHHHVDIVLDIGANDGGYATELREAGWRGPLVSFEPQPAAFGRLKERFIGDAFWSGHQIGLGSVDETLNMNVHHMDVLSSFLEKIEESESASQIEVEVKRMDGILDNILGHHRRPFVKIDTQGFELQVIKGFGAMTDRVVGWQLEMSVEPLYQNQVKIEEVIALMRSLGFSLWKIIPGLRDPKTLQSFEFDGVFFKST
ncbi:FkbM family methyltransferase [Luteolibacter soli]|uniref:FkbM family methyltransferase n=1 Tax=Luteolibacter soli TaxID=3135280 RepID=A0ABU9ASX1_9BACT